MQLNRRVNRKQARLPKQQKGVALLIALMVAALISVIAIELSWQFDLSITRSGNRWQGIQANTYLDASENLAVKVLTNDLNNQDSKNDNLGELWATQKPQFPTDHGYIAGSLEDASARFNLNSLGGKPPKGAQNAFDAKKYNEPQRRFIRLLQTLENDEGIPLLQLQEAQAIAESVIDWVDVNTSETGFGGAEGDYYQQLNPPFVIANDVMSSVSELSLIKGMTPEIYRRLLPLVIALPANVTLNVNTAPEALLRTINFENDLMPLSKSDVQRLMTDRQNNPNGFDSCNDFVAQGTEAAVLFPVTISCSQQSGGDQGNTPQQGGENTPENTPQANQQQNKMDMTGLGTASDYFILSSETMVGDHIRTRKTLLKREKNTRTVLPVRRTDANL